MIIPADLSIKLVGGSSFWSSKLFGVLIGGAISLATALFTTFGLEHLRWRRASEGLARAVAAEVEASLRMFRFRRAREFIYDLCMLAEKGDLRVFHMEFGDEYLPISRKSVDRIGSLRGDMPHLLSEFLTLTNSLRQDLARLNALSTWDSDQDGLVRMYREMLVIIDRGFEVGDALVNEAARQYRGVGIAPWNRASDPTAAANGGSESLPIPTPDR